MNLDIWRLKKSKKFDLDKKGINMSEKLKNTL